MQVIDASDGLCGTKMRVGTVLYFISFRNFLVLRTLVLLASVRNYRL